MGGKEKRRYLVISVHDVTPALECEAKEIVDELRREEIGRKSILVIPNYRGKYNILKERGFLSWLHSLRKEGDEIVHHGYEHISQDRRYSSFYDYLRGEFFAQGCAEFQNISYGDARNKIKRGREIFNRAGLSCDGFIPPGWLMSRGANKAVMDEGFKYTAFIKFLRDYESKMDVRSEAIRFIPRSKVVDYLKKMYNEYLLRCPLRDKKLIRVAIHPQDLHTKRAFEYLLKIVEKLKKERIVTTYLDFLKVYIDRTVCL